MNALSARANNLMERNISDYGLRINKFFKNSDYNLVNSHLYPTY